MDRLERLKLRLQQYLEAEAACLRGAEYTIGSRRLRRADLEQIREAINELQAEIDTIELNSGRIGRVVF